MFNYLVEHVIENLFSMVLWFLIGWAVFSPSKIAKVAGALLMLVPLASYYGQYSGGQQSAEPWVWTIVSALVGLGLGYLLAARLRPASTEQNKLTREEMIGRLRRMIDDPDTTEEKRGWATGRLNALENTKS